MKIILTHEIDPFTLPEWEREQVYNGLDCCVTHEVLSCQLPQLDEVTSKTYDFERALQGPVLDLNIRGVLIDKSRRAKAVEQYFDIIEKVEHNLQRIAIHGLGMSSFNWRSTADLKILFYTKLMIPPVIRRGNSTVNRAALEKIGSYFSAKFIVQSLILLREAGKKIGVLQTKLDDDGRIRTSYNIAGTTTGRFSSSYSDFGTGGNLQNIEKPIRPIYIADPGMKFAKFDAKSGESFVVGAIEWNLFHDSRYLEACESGDPHTAVARICWPSLPWTGDFKHDKDIAEQPYYRHYTYRFMCKKLGHGSNYGGMPQTLAEQSKLPIQVVEKFQPMYFKAFPAHLRWQAHVDTQLRRHGNITSLMGRRRYFSGRRNSPDTLREAIAYDPQSSLADIVNKAMLRIWRLDICTIILQDHDAITFMYPEEAEAEILPQLASLLPERIPLANGRFLEIPYDCQVGWNRGEYDPKKNPDGLKDYFGTDDRRRTPKVSIMDRSFHQAHR